jgi:hypothetical protein
MRCCGGTEKYHETCWGSTFDAEIHAVARSQRKQAREGRAKKRSPAHARDDCAGARSSPPPVAVLSPRSIPAAAIPALKRVQDERVDLRLRPQQQGRAGPGAAVVALAKRLEHIRARGTLAQPGAPLDAPERALLHARRQPSVIAIKSEQQPRQTNHGHRGASHVFKHAT